ncbi:MAG: hypothetical protein JO000_05080, partial [Alphaproteobacteria bacterium]|nr:hypothetical protein [Alphaproteobacteria bacterium]
DIALQGEDQKTAQAIVRQSLHAGIDLAFWLAAALALLAALTAALTIPPTEKKPPAVPAVAPG